MYVVPILVPPTTHPFCRGMAMPKSALDHVTAGVDGFDTTVAVNRSESPDLMTAVGGDTVTLVIVGRVCAHRIGTSPSFDDATNENTLVGMLRLMNAVKVAA